MQKVIVTGGAGFIGSAVARYLVLELNCSVVVIDKMTYAANEANLSPLAGDPRCRLIVGDCCNQLLMSNIIEQERPDWIMHLAAESHVDRSISGPRDFIETNVIGTYSMLEAARAYWGGLKGEQRDQFRFLHVSTDEVYGSLEDDGLFREDTPYDPSSPYSASKAASDHLAKAWHRTYGLPVVISNCSNNYGPYHFPEKLIPLMILNALDGLSLPIYGKGDNVRDWLYVDDHASALAMIVSKGRVGETYNVGGGNERTNLQVVEAICDILDELVPSERSYRDLMTFVTDRPGHDHRYAIDATKLESEIGWKAKQNFESGLRKTVEWYLANEMWWKPLRKQREGGSAVSKAVPLSQDEVITSVQRG